MYGKRKETTAIAAAYKGVILEENTNSALDRKLFRVSFKKNTGCNDGYKSG